MKELPYFRFTVSEWMNGDISMETYDSKGIFIDICAWYWFKDCSITKAMLEKKYPKEREWIKNLLDIEAIKIDGDNIQIEFLNEQFDLLSKKRRARQAAGSKGGKQKSSNAKTMLKQKPSYKDKDKDKDKIYISFIELFNTITTGKFKGTKKDRGQFSARINDEYTLDDFKIAITNCFNDDYHKSNPHFLTPEFITRADKLEKYLNSGPPIPPPKKYPDHNDMIDPNWRDRVR